MPLSWFCSEKTNLATNKITAFTGDTPTVLNTVYQYEITSRWNLGLHYSYRTGAAYTPIIGIEPNPDYAGLYCPVYGDLNSRRLPDYQRLDLRTEYEFRIFDNKATFIFEILNLFDNDNIIGESYAPRAVDTVNNFTIEREKGFGVFPSVGLEVKF